jgi:hypothetical protein
LIGQRREAFPYDKTGKVFVQAPASTRCSLENDAVTPLPQRLERTRRLVPRSSFLSSRSTEVSQENDAKTFHSDCSCRTEIFCQGTSKLRLVFPVELAGRQRRRREAVSIARSISEIIGDRSSRTASQRYLPNEISYTSVHETRSASRVPVEYHTTGD